MTNLTGACEVHIGDALGLLSAFTWLHELNLELVNFELIRQK
jgi:hypothetical protein